MPSQMAPSAALLNQEFPIIYMSTSQTISLSGSNQQSSAVGVSTTVVRLVSTQPALIAIGPNPDASSTHNYLPANSAEYFAIHGGDKVGALQAATGGVLYITEGG